MNMLQPLLSKNTDIEFPSRLLHLLHDARLFDNMGSLKKVPKNTIFIEAGDPPRYCYVLKKGCVVGFEYAPSGDERVYDIMLPQSLLLEMNLFLNKPSPVYFKAVKPSELICIERHTLLDRMRGDFRLTMAVIESLSNKFYVAMEQVRETKCHGAAWRFCNLLLMFAEFYGVPYDKKTLIREQVSQQILSNLLGVNRITINRISTKLKDLALIEQINGLYCISDMEKLKQHMDYLDP